MEKEENNRRTDYGTERLDSTFSSPIGGTKTSSSRRILWLVLTIPMFATVVITAGALSKTNLWHSKSSLKFRSDGSNSDKNEDRLFAIHNQVESQMTARLRQAAVGSARVNQPDAGVCGCQRSLLLLRHAKSSWDDVSLEDFDRPLAPSGIQQAQQLGQYLENHQVMLPDTILASPSVRTKQTIALVQQHWAGSLPVTFDMQLFTDALDSYWSFLHHSLPKDSSRILLVGHNPAIESLAMELSSRDEISKVKPATFIEFHWSSGDCSMCNTTFWRDIRPGSATLTRFLPPNVIARQSANK